MNTPIRDFVRSYASSGTTRLHMPGHKGAPALGCESLDITEIAGADSLYEASGIIAQSEANASALFGCPTFYSTEGSSQCIRAMVQLARLHALAQGRQPRIAAGRNAHKTFLTAVALLDVAVDWLYPRDPGSCLACPLEPEDLDAHLRAEPATAVYLTAPDYLGHVPDIRSLTQVCHRHGALLLVDNAHGAYLRFLNPSRHPMDLGADLCCDSAHKTLPVLTGGAYLHVADPALAAQAKNALALFGSTSPSYLILQSLDLANAYLAGDYPQKLTRTRAQMAALGDRLTARGYTLLGDEPMKLTIASKSYGYTGTDLAQYLRQHGLECEFADPDFLVLMVTPESGPDALEKLEAALSRCPRREPIHTQPPCLPKPCQIRSLRDGALGPCRMVPIQETLGKILGAVTVSCPPAVPILVCGERIDEAAIACFAYYGITECAVMEEGRS